MILGFVVIGGVLIIYFWGPLGEAQPSWKCIYNLGLTANPYEVQADGIDQASIVATLSQGKGKSKTLVSGVFIDFSSTIGRLSANFAVTDSSGQAKVFISSTQAGTASVKSQIDSCIQFVEVQFVAGSPGEVLFSDDFSGDLSKWTQAWNGYGTIKIENGTLMMAPKASTSPGETHSALIRSGDLNSNDYIYNVKMNTAEQLRTGNAPNYWEVGWLTFRHQDNYRFYYFVLKPNGIELGKALGNNQQAFLVTESTPKLQLGQWNNFRITLKGANVKVFINGSLVTDYTDTNNPFLTGGIGLYNEDAKVYYDDVVVTAN
jgi:hypothetical protein